MQVNGHCISRQEAEMDEEQRYTVLSQGLTDAAAWQRYRKWFADWPSDRARVYIDFHCRHLTLGEVGAALAHAKYIDDAFHDDIDVNLFFEDDARPLPGAVQRLLEEVTILERHAHAWDLIYLR